MQVNWTPKAMEMADSVLRYTAQTFGKAQADKLRLSFANIAKQLESFPYMGTLDPFLTDLAKEYRFILIYNTLKVIYHISDSKRLFIVAVWNCRQSPHELKNILSNNLK